MTYKDLMTNANYKYKNLVDGGQWEAPDAQQEDLMALKCEWKNIKSQLKKKKRSRNENKKEKGQKKKKEVKKDKPEWMNNPPPKEGPFTKMLDGKLYHFCSTKNGAPFQRGLQQMGTP